MRDAIDFPCSATFRSFYASQGLTPDYPAEYYDGVRSSERERALEEQNLELQAELELARRGAALTEPAVRSTESKYSNRKNVEATLNDLSRDVNGLKKMVHTHSKKSSSLYKEYEVD